MENMQKTIGEGISRRSFLKGCGVIAAGAAIGSADVLGSQAWAAEAQSSLPESIQAIEPVGVPASWDYEADIIVVGSGGAGGAAATQAAELGAKVIVVEKGYWGGSTNYTEAWDVPVEPPMPIEAEMNMEANYPSAISHKDQRVARAIVDRRAETAEWLQKNCGVVFSKTQPESLANMFRLQYGEDWSPEVFRMGIPIDPDDQEAGHEKWFPYNGIGFTKAFQKRCEDLSVQIMTRTPAIAVVVEGDMVVGVKARTEDNEEIYLKGSVILACGGYGANDEMLEHYLPDRWKRNLGSYSGVHTNEGDGHRMAQGVGAMLWAMDEIELFDGGTSYPLGRTALYEAAKQAERQPSLVVNKFCQRFFNEAAPAGNYVTGQAVQKGTQPFAKTYTILDASCIYADDVIEVFRPIICEYPVPWYDEQMEERIDEGTVKKADTLEELAELLELDPSAFVKAVEDYNAICDSGVDTEFFKPARYLHALRTPPYYGIEGNGGGSALNTWGGLRVSPERHVYNENWEPIKGLYAAGEVSAYGAHNTTAIPSGRIAAETAVKELNEL